jgi:hypothetical protein
MKKLALSLFVLFNVVIVTAQDLHHTGDVNKNITPFNDAKEAINGLNTSYLQKQAAWQQFKQHYPSWGAKFNRYTQLPHRAFGDPITFNGGGNDAVSKAKAFLQQEFAGFNLPINDLVATRNYNDGKYIHVDFKQVHNNVEVLWSRVGVRFTQDLRIILVGIDAHRDIPGLIATITPAVAIQKAEQAISTQITNSTISNDMKIFPYPLEGKYDYRLAYSVNVETINDNGVVGNYLTYVDAKSGEILYRQDQVKYFDIKIKGDVRPINFYTPTQNRPMKNMKVVVGSTTYYTNNEGKVVLPTSPVTANISLQGKWAKVINSAASATNSAAYNHTFPSSGDSTTFDVTALNANDRGVNVYYHVNEVHDFMKTKFPSFTVMDYPLPSNVDQTGTCNAYYNGSSINFLLAGASCLAFSYVGDVMSHEYGHGINDKFYDDQGSSFDNGGMNEGYADTWANCILKTGRIGYGYNSATSYIRRYDLAPKVYPADIVGEVHADGEIIAGAWWDVALNWNSVDSMGDLFASTFYGLATGPDGNEGEVYHDILIDALTYDDDNNNLNDGTPHFNIIVQAFATHGIYLLSNTTLNHASPGSISALTPVTISADAVVDYPAFLGKVEMIYRTKGTTITDTIIMTKSGTNYTCQFPSSPNGVVYEYVFAIYDNTNYLTVFSPENSAFNNGFTQRNIPHYLLTGYNSVFNEPFDNVNSSTIGWTIGNASNDNATAGKWIVAIPISSVTNGDTVQTGKDHTSGTGFCAVTGNAGAANFAAGNADVDGGRTTLITKSFDLSTYNQPVISYWRWYTNSQNANSDPGKDMWRVWISYNDGATWNILEKTYKPDVSWRRSVVVADLTQGTKAKLMFTATDSVYTGVSGTWVEAAVDDIQILELGNGAVNNIQDISDLKASIYPNPAANEITVVTPETGLLSYTILNTVGEVVIKNEKALLTDHSLKINTSSLTSGIYFVKLASSDRTKTLVQRIVIAK